MEDECGSDAADHQLEIEKSYLRPRAEAIDCDLGTINTSSKSKKANDIRTL